MGFFIMTKEEMIAEFKLWFPELSEKDESVINLAYKLADNAIKKGVWRNLYEEGFLYRMAHIVQMRTGGANGGAIDTTPMVATSKTVGKLSIGYSDTSAASYADAGEFAYTIYGKHYFDLRKNIKPTGRVI